MQIENEGSTVSSGYICINLVCTLKIRRDKKWHIHLEITSVLLIFRPKIFRPKIFRPQICLASPGHVTKIVRGSFFWNKTRHFVYYLTLCQSGRKPHEKSEFRTRHFCGQPRIFFYKFSALFQHFLSIILSHVKSKYENFCALCALSTFLTAYHFPSFP